MRFGAAVAGGRARRQAGVAISGPQQLPLPGAGEAALELPAAAGGSGPWADK